MGGSKKTTTGYRYYMGLHFAICQGPVDALTEVKVGNRIAWSGSQTANGTISISAPNLFGGDKKEGGVEGSADVLMGGSAQTQNAYLAEKVSADAPAYRGVLSFVYKAGLIAANNPYIKPWAFKVKRILQGWHGGSAWYSAKAAIGTDMNPAHIIYQCLTDPTWGMGYPTSQVDTTTFTAVADTLYSESFGLSMIWNQQQEIGAFVGQVLDHIGGTLYVDPTTGKFALKLIRDDYDAGDLEVYDESNAVLENFQRVAYADTVNEITVVYRDGTTGQDSAVTVQDLANIQAQGAVVSQTRQYPGISNGTLAAKVAMRDLLATSTPLARIQLRVNRDGWALIPGDVFKLSWSKHGLTEVIFRVLDINYGTLTDGRITVSAAEDVFGLPSSVYASQQPGGFVEPDGSPVEISEQDVQEATYYQLATSFTAADFAQIDPVDGAYFTTLAGKPAALNTDYTIWSRVGSADFEERQVAPMTPTATLADNIGPGDTVLEYENGTDVDDAEVGKLAWLGSGATAEAVEVIDIDTDAGTITVKRGCIDTVPQAHAAGARIWLCGDSFIGYDPTERATGEEVDFRLTTIATGGELDVDDVDIVEMSATAAQRFARPYPPGWLRINGSSYPETITGTATISWAHRDRTLQTAGLLGDGDGNVGPETDVTYTLRLYGETDNLLRTLTGLTGTSYAFSDELIISGLGDLGPVSTISSENAEATLTGWTCEMDLSDPHRWHKPLYWDGTRFVAFEYDLSGSGSRQIWTSTTGSSWSKVSGGVMPAYGPYACGGGYYLANGGQQYSTDLVTWSGSAIAADVEALIWDGSQFVRITSSGNLQTSATGASWSTVVALSSFMTWSNTGTTYLSKCELTWYISYTPIGGSPTPQLWSSTNLTSWTQRATALLANWDSISAVVTNGGGTYVIAGKDGASDSPVIAKSTDSTTFAAVTVPSFNSYGPLSVNHADGQFFIVFSPTTDTDYIVCVSTDGTTWTQKGMSDFTFTGASITPTEFSIEGFVHNGAGTRCYEVMHDDYNSGTQPDWRIYRAVTTNNGSWSSVGSTTSISTEFQVAACRMTSTRIAVCRRMSGTAYVQAYDWTGSGWSSVGSAYSTATSGNGPRVAAISNTDIAFIESGTRNLTRLTFNGSTWSTVGSALSVGGSTGNHAMTHMGSYIVRASQVDGTLTVYSNGGSSWTSHGSSGSPSMSGAPSVAGMESTSLRVAFYDAGSEQLRMLGWSGSAWSQVGNALTLTGVSGVVALTSISSTDVAVLDRNTDDLRLYRFDGTNWTQIGSMLTVTLGGTAFPSLTWLGAGNVAKIDSDSDTMQMYLWTPDVAYSYSLALVAPTPATATRDLVIFNQGAASMSVADPFELGVGLWKSFAGLLVWDDNQITIDAYMRAASGEVPEVACGNYEGTSVLEHVASALYYSIKLNVAAGKAQFTLNGTEKVAVSYALSTGTWYRVKAVVSNGTVCSLYLYAANGTTLLGSTLATALTGGIPASTGDASFLWAKGAGRYDAVEVSGGTWVPRLNNSLRVKLKAVRDGLDSWQEHDYTVER